MKKSVNKEEMYDIIKNNTALRNAIFYLVIYYRQLSWALEGQIEIKIRKIFDNQLKELLDSQLQRITLPKLKPGLEDRLKSSMMQLTKEMIANSSHNKSWTTHLISENYRRNSQDFLVYLKYPFQEPLVDLAYNSERFMTQYAGRSIRAKTESIAELKGLIQESRRHINEKISNHIEGAWHRSFIPTWPNILLIFGLIFLLYPLLMGKNFSENLLGKIFFAFFIILGPNRYFRISELVDIVEYFTPVKRSTMSYSNLSNEDKNKLSRELDLVIEPSRKIKISKVLHQDNMQPKNTSHNDQPGNETGKRNNQIEMKKNKVHSEPIEGNPLEKFFKQRKKELAHSIPNWPSPSIEEPETVSFTVPDQRETSIVWQVGSIHHDFIHNLWSSNSRLDAVRFDCVYIYRALLDKLFESAKLPQEYVEPLLQTANFKHVVSRENKAGFIYIDKQSDAKNFSELSDAQQILHYPTYKLKTMHANEIRVGFYYWGVFASNRGNKYTLYYPGQALTIKHA